MDGEHVVPLGCDPNRTILFAQVRSGEPQMSMDEEGFLRPLNIPNKTADIYLGDVANASLRSLGPHEPPKFTQRPEYDEQRWELTSNAGEINIRINSDSYWGFGLLARCFYNRIVLSGPLSLRARIVHDIVASLGRNPWEAAWLKMLERKSGATYSEHAQVWQELVEFAGNEMNDEIEVVEDAIRALRGIDKSIEIILEQAMFGIEDARAALADRNAPAVERALGRAITALVEADPETKVRSSEFEAQYTTYSAPLGKPKQNEVRAEHLLEEDIPFIDLTESE